MIHRPVAPGPGSEGATPWAGSGEAGYLDGEGRWVKVSLFAAAIEKGDRRDDKTTV